MRLPTRWGRWGASLFLGAIAAWLLIPSPAFAHASVASLDPAPGSVLADLPRAIRIRFSEPITPFARGLDVYRPDGRRISGNATAVGDTLVGVLDPGGASRGTYLVEWRIVAQDTHPSRGSYSFSVGQPGPIPAAGALPAGDLGAVAPLGLLLQALARWLHFLGFALSFGVLAFNLLVLRELQPSPRLRRLVYLGIGLLVVAEPIALVAQAASLGTIDSPSLADVLGSAFGRVLALRLAAALVLWGILGAPRETLGAGIWSVLLVGGLLALADGLSGHTIRGVPLLFSDLLTAVHVASMVVWVGGLAALLAVLATASDKRALVGRFGRYAAASAALLLVSGGVLALDHLRSPADLVFSPYGLTLALKLAAVAAALWFAWTGLRRFRSGRPELLGLAGVLALAALLASWPPPR